MNKKQPKIPPPPPLSKEPPKINASRRRCHDRENAHLLPPKRLFRAKADSISYSFTHMSAGALASRNQRQGRKSYLCPITIEYFNSRPRTNTINQSEEINKSSKMIFVLHYILFSSGLSFVIILTALFLQTYSDASMAEIGGLLMALPFLSIFARPFFCALADRHQAHKLYLMGACFTMALGYGSLSIAPFFPDFIRQHGRLVWCLDVIGIIIGYSSFSVVFSLGDALALNAARKRGISWSLYRVWSTLSWGVFGYLIGLINETPALPEYVPGIFLLIIAMLIEIVLVGVWDKKAFDMNDNPGESDAIATHIEQGCGDRTSATLERKCGADNRVMEDRLSQGVNETLSRSPFGTMSGVSARLMGALAGMVVEDIGSTLKSSLRMSKREKRAGLSGMLELHGTEQMSSPKITPSSALSRKMSLANVEDAEKIKNSNTSLDLSNISGRASIARSLGQAAGQKLSRMEDEAAGQRSILKKTVSEQVPARTTDWQLTDVEGGSKSLARNGEAENYGDDLQMLLLKFIVRRDESIIKSLVSFALFGFLMAVHASYLFVHVEQVCRQGGYNFSKVMGTLVAAQSASEIFGFIVMVRYYMPLVGRMGSLLSCAVLLGSRFVYYGTYFSVISPYYALAAEVCYGMAYAMIYTLVCDCACDCVEQLGQYLPELISRGLIDPSINANQLKLPLRATMQGVFSGAFDGLGYGLGALFGGVFLQIFNDYIGLWQVSAGISGLTFLYIILTYRTGTTPVQKLSL